MLRLAALAFALVSVTAPAGPRPPVARVEDEVTVTLHGEPRHDEYAWLRAGAGDRRVRAYLDAENAYGEALMRPHRRLIRTLEQEIESRAYVDDESAPVRRGAWLYWTRHQRDRDHPVILRKPADVAGDAQVVLDLEALARGKPFFDLGVFELSDDGRWLAYSVDEVGSEDYTLFVKDLETGALGPEKLLRVTSAAWSAGARELLYTVRDDTFRSYALRGRTRGAGGQDRLVYEEKDVRFDLEVERSRSGEWLFLRSSSYAASEVRVARAEQPAGAWTVVAGREAGHLYDVDHAGDTFYIRSNRGAPMFRVFAAPERDPAAQPWLEILPEKSYAAITRLDAFETHLALHVRDSGRPRVWFFELATGKTIEAGDVELRRQGKALTQDVVSIRAGENHDPKARSYRVHVEAANEPEQTVDLLFRDGGEWVVHRRPVPGPCGSAERLPYSARATDGAEIRFLRFSGAGAGAGPRPLLLEAYGAYGSVYDPDFDAARCSLLDRGVDFVIAQVRGGGEKGEPWHDAGRKLNRMTPIGDLVAVAGHLVATGATTPDRLVVAGDSAGGALVAATVNQRPDLFAAAVLRVPFLDAVGTMADPNAPLTTTEYDEWGDPAVRAEYEVLKQWCPYTNLAAQVYPAILVESSLSDARVVYHEQTRWVARLRRRAAGGGPFVLRTELHAGHAGASGRREWLRARAFEVAFILSRLGLTPAN